MTDIKFGGSSSTSEWSSLAFPKPMLHPHSFSITPIEILDHYGNLYSHATGFISRHQDTPFLVTSWHVLSGRDFFTRELGSDGLIPEKFRVYIPSFIQIENKLTIESNAFTLNLSEQLQGTISEPPNPFGFPVDIAVVRLPITTEKSGSFTSQGFDEFVWGYDIRTVNPIRSMIGSEVFVIGYPLRTYEELKTPIWKRGSIASEPSLAISPVGAFLIDINSGSGMSGGPIIRRVVSFTANNKDDQCIQEYYDEMIVGVYSGRAKSPENPQLVIGYAWPIDMVEKIIIEKQSISC